jgi:ferric-dicitrate binding protein FerR (iron transport regulator)
MSRSAAFRALSCITLVFFLAGNVFADAAAMVEPTGTVLVNDTQVTRVSTVFAGDRVKTGTGSGAVISSKGATILLAANSAMTVGANHLALDQGSASATLAPGESAEVSSLTLTATGDAPASYDVSRGCGFVQITVKSGTLSVASGNGAPTTLTAGNSQKFEIAKTAECGTPPPNNNTVAIVTGGVVALAAGLIVWFTTGEASPSVP